MSGTEIAICYGAVIIAALLIIPVALNDPRGRSRVGYQAAAGRTGQKKRAKPIRFDPSSWTGIDEDR